MKKLENKWIPIFLLVITVTFFYKFFLHGLLPIPGDLLISQYNPWKSYAFLGYVPGSFPNKAQYFDVIRQIYPWKTLVIEMLLKGQFPLWNPYNFSGSPLFANVQSAVLYPFNIFLLLLPFKLGWSFMIFLESLLAGIFTYFFARKIKLTVLPSLFAAISFAFSSFLSVWVEYNTIDQVILWLPLLLLSGEYVLEGKLYWSSIFIFALVASLFGGHIQIFGYLLLFVIFYLFHRIMTKENRVLSRRKSWMLLSSLVVISLGIGAIQLIPSFELIQYAARSAHPYGNIINKILIQPWQLIMMLLPDFFGNPATRNYFIADTYVGKVTSIGIISFVFAILGVLGWTRSTLVRFFIGTALVVLIFVTNNPLTQILYHFDIPFFSSSAPTLSIFLFCFSLSMLAGFGVKKMLEGKLLKRELYEWIAISVGIVIIFLGIGIFANTQVRQTLMIQKSIPFHAFSYGMIFVMIFLGIVSIIVVRRKVLYIGIIILLLMQLFDTFHAFQKFNPFVPSQLVFPPTDITTYLQKNAGISRVWGYQAANIEPNIETFYHLYSAEGYDPLYPKWYGEFIQSSMDGKIHTQFSDATRSDAVIAKQMSTQQLQVLDSLGIKYILDKTENASTEKTFPTDRFSPIYENTGWKVFENKKALPRFFLTDSYLTYTSRADFENKFFSKDRNPKTILVNTTIPTQLSQINANDSIKLLSYSPNTIRFQTNATGNKLLFLSDTYYPGWVAQVDGKVTPIYKANYAFRAILIPTGRHSITFTFDPQSFKIGILVSIASSFLFLICMLFIRRSKNKVN